MSALQYIKEAALHAENYNARQKDRRFFTTVVTLGINIECYNHKTKKKTRHLIPWLKIEQSITNPITKWMEQHDAEVRKRR